MRPAPQRQGRLGSNNHEKPKDPAFDEANTKVQKAEDAVKACQASGNEELISMAKADLEKAKLARDKLKTPGSLFRADWAVVAQVWHPTSGVT